MMWSAVSTVFFLAMAPLGLMAEEVEATVYLTSNAPGAVGEEGQHQTYLRKGGGHEREQEHRGLISNKMATLLDLHNEARCLHKAKPLQYKYKVARSAQAHADALANSCGKLFHSPREDRSGYGENIFACTGKTGSGSRPGVCYTPEGAMKALCDNKNEAKTNRVQGYGGHATQILSKSTTQLGCAEATCTRNTKKTAFLVCQYNPTGNVNLSKRVTSEVGLPTGKNC